MDKARSLTTALPPFLRRGRDTEKPTLVKNIFINNVCRVLSKVIYGNPVTYRVVFSVAKTRPPTNGDGMQYRFNIAILSVIRFPIQNSTAATATA